MFSLFERKALPALGAVLALGGCGVSQSVVGTAGSLPPVAFDRHAHGRSWMSPEAKRQRLLYVSDSRANAVYVFTYPNGTLAGTLTGFQEPWGMCSDRAGDVFVADVWNFRLLEFAHGGTTPIATFTDDDGHPTNCSVDPSTGNLAVVYYFLNDPSRSTEIAVYSNAQGTGQRFTGSKLADGMWACAYDDRGNLFVDGTYGYISTNVGLAELPRNQSKLLDIVLGTHIQYLSGIQWTGKYLAMADQSGSRGYPATIYQLSVSGTNAAQVGATELYHSEGVEQFWVEGDRVTVPSEDNAGVRFYPYPAGGQPTKTLGGFVAPFGVTVSKASN